MMRTLTGNNIHVSKSLEHQGIRSISLLVAYTTAVSTIISRGSTSSLISLFSYPYTLLAREERGCCSLHLAIVDHHADYVIVEVTSRSLLY
jgi:hypothetical protein